MKKITVCVGLVLAVLFLLLLVLWIANRNDWYHKALCWMKNTEERYSDFRCNPHIN